MYTLRIERIKYNNTVLLFILYLALFVCFEFVVKDLHIFRKAKLTYEISFLKLTIGLTLVVFNIVLLTILKTKDFLYSISVLVLIFFVFPSAILFTYVNNIDYRIFASHNLFLISLLLLGLIRIKIKSRRIEIYQSIGVLKVIVILGLVPFVILFSPHINFKNLLLLEIYETRAAMDATVNNLYTNYTYSSFNKFIIPCLLIFSIFYKNRISILICSLSIIFLYLCGAHKAVFIGLIFTFLLYKHDYVRKVNYLLNVLIGIAIISLLMSIVFNDDFLMNISIRRTLFIPSLLDVLYFDFFDNNHLYWSESFNGLWMEYPYQYEHSYVVGEKYFNDITWGANNGIISDGFMNFGMLGVLFNVIIVSLYISILVQLRISPRFFGLFFLFIFLVLSSSLTTVLLTHGGIILIVLSFLFMKDTEKKMM